MRNELMIEFTKKFISPYQIYSNSIVKYLNGFKNAPSGLHPNSIFLNVDRMCLQCMQECLYNTIFIIFASTAHALGCIKNAILDTSNLIVYTS